MSTNHVSRRRPGAVALVAGVLGIILLAGAGWLFLQRQSNPGFEAAGEIPAADPAVVPATGKASVSPGVKPSDIRALEDASFTPERLQIPQLGVNALVTPVGVEPNGSLVIPEDPKIVGWWSSGAAPGSPVGTVLMSSHVDSAKDGPGALYKLSQSPIGSKITVKGKGGDVTYAVQARRRYPKAGLPWDSLLAQGMQPRLVLVTCGGDFDYETRHYTDNIVVVAVPTK